MSIPAKPSAPSAEPPRYLVSSSATVAAEFYCLNARLSTGWSWIWKDSGLAFGQLILEGSVPGAENASWIHISVGEPYRKPEKCRQVLVYDGSKYSRVDTSAIKVV